jgi:hypothetical protein
MAKDDLQNPHTVAEATRSGKPYQIRLDVGPADARLAQPHTCPTAEKMGAQ